jgi:hypothetical protein
MRQGLNNQVCSVSQSVYGFYTLLLERYNSFHAAMKIILDATLCLHYI